MKNQSNMKRIAFYLCCTLLLILTASSTALGEPGDPLYTLAVSNGVVKSPDKEAYEAGEKVSLTPAPASGYSFFKWTIVDQDARSTEDRQDNPLELVMTVNYNVTAYFTNDSQAHWSTVTIQVDPHDSPGCTLEVYSPSILRQTITSGTFKVPQREGIWINPKPISGYTLSHFNVTGPGVQIPYFSNEGESVGIDTTFGGTLTAHFMPKQYHQKQSNSRILTVYIKSGEGSIDIMQPLVLKTMVNNWNNPRLLVFNQGQNVTLKANPKTGLALSGWNIDGVNNVTRDNPLTIAMDKHKLITANFGPAPSTANYTLEMQVGEGGTAKVKDTNVPELASQTFSFPKNSEVILTASPISGYKFVNWIIGDTLIKTENPYTLKLDSNKIVKAGFSPFTPRRLNLAVTGSGWVQVFHSRLGYWRKLDSGAIEVNQGENLTLMPVADSGFSFKGWSGAASGTDLPLTLTMDTDKTLTANFAYANRKLRIKASAPVEITSTANFIPQGFNVAPSLRDAVLFFSDRQELNLKAIFNEAQYAFDGWSINDGPKIMDNPLVVSMDSDKSITNRLIPLSPNQLGVNFAGPGQIKVSYPGTSTTITSSKSFTVPYGTVVTLAATPASGYVFAGWKNEPLGFASTANITLDNNKNVWARFIPLSSQTWLNISSSIGGSITMFSPAYALDITSGKFPVAKGENVTLRADAQAGYVFNSWLLDGVESTNATIQIPMDKDKSVSANFSSSGICRLRLTMPTQASEISVKKQDGTTLTYKEPGEYTLEFKRNEGVFVTVKTNRANFDYWSQDADTTANPVVIVMDRDKNLTPVFKNLFSFFCLGKGWTGPNMEKLMYWDPYYLYSQAPDQTMFATPSFWAKWAYSSPEVEFQFKGWRINLDQDKTLDNPLSFKPDTTKVIRAYAEPKAPYFFQFKLNYEEGQMIASGKGLPCPKHVHNYCVLFFRAPGTSLWKSISRTILSILSSSFIAPFSYPQPTNYPAGEYLAIYYAAMPNNVTHTTIDEYQQYIPVAVSNIVQLMSAGMLGDVSGDGSITAYDAALTTMIALGMDVSGLGLPADYRARADVDGVAGVSLLDAALIAQRAVGLISRFPVEG